MTFDVERAKRLAAEAAEDDERMTKAPWCIAEEWEDEYAGDKKWRRINSEQDMSHEAAICEVGDWNHDGDADSAGIMRARNNLAAMAEMLRAAIEYIQMCEAELADRRRDVELDARLAEFSAVNELHLIKQEKRLLIQKLDEAWTERDAARAEVERMRAVYEAVLAWRASMVPANVAHGHYPMRDLVLARVVDAATTPTPQGGK